MLSLAKNALIKPVQKRDVTNPTMLRTFFHDTCGINIRSSPSLRNSEIMCSSILMNPRQILQRSAECGAAAENSISTLSDGCEAFECRWGRKWFGNYCNLPRNSHTPYGNKKRLWKFRVKKQQFKHRQKKKRMKIAAIGNTPFNKKIRVEMTSRFEHANENDVNTVNNESKSSDSSAAGKNKVESFSGKRAKSKYTS